MHDEAGPAAPLARLLILLSVARFCYPSIHKIIYNEFHPSKSNVGYFVSPNFPHKYPENVRYFYIFVGTKNHQVQLTFNHFNIEGLSHSCDKDYLDIYIEVKSLSGTVNVSEDLFQEALLGRYCGHNLDFIPRTVVSKYNVIILDFFSDKNTQQSYNQDDHMGQLGFNGSYEFRLNEFNLKFWTASPHNSCYYLVHSNDSKSGHIQSINYPGLLPSPLNCIYEFRSNDPKHRIELKFIDFNLFQQDEMCPVEYVEIFDEQPPQLWDSRSVAGRLCGQKPSYRFVSTHNRAYLRLVVLAGRDYMKVPRNIDLYKGSLQNTGFRIRYKFSEYFVPLKRISNNRNRIPGSECDILIQSKGRSHGVLVSAGMDSVEVLRPRICNYYFFGIHNSQNMETVLLEFSYLNIPTMDSKNCSKGSLSMYSAKFKLRDLVKRRRSVFIKKYPDRILCGDITVPFSFKSRNPVFLLRMNVTEMKADQPIGFKLSYKFMKDYGILGEMPTPGECHYRYESQLNGDSGLINSPFFSSFYPNNATCRYDLLANKDEIIRIVFQVFQTSEDVSPKLVSPHEVHLSCRQDYLSVSEIIRTPSGALRTDNTERYCGTTIPGLLVSQQSSIGFTLVFQSDATKNGPGFLAKYEFLKKLRVFADKCGENVNAESLYGQIWSPNFPRRYPADLICEWYLRNTGSMNRYLLLFTNFQIEGTTKSCSNAVVRIYEGSHASPQAELCGTDSAIPAYESKGNFVRVRFLTAVSAKGAKGFQLVWTQILPRLGNGSCIGFQCINSGHCINASLTCNKVPNCGSYIATDGSTVIDTSDEADACPVKQNHTYLYSGLAVVVTIFFLVTVVILYFVHKNKDLLKRRLKVKVNSTHNNNCSDLLDQRVLTSSHSLLKDRPTSSASESVRGSSRLDRHTRSRNGSLLAHDTTSNHHKQFSFDLDATSIKSKARDQMDGLSETGSFHREKMQKISNV